jgi:hypothetical protein
VAKLTKRTTGQDGSNNLASQRGEFTRGSKSKKTWLIVENGLIIDLIHVKVLRKLVEQYKMRDIEAQLSELRAWK